MEVERWSGRVIGGPLTDVYVYQAPVRIWHWVTMQGLAIVNPALEVEAVGFAPWQDHWLGVMVTPWFMSEWLAWIERGARAARAPRLAGERPRLQATRLDVRDHVKEVRS